MSEVTLIAFASPAAAQLTADEFAYLRERLLDDLEYAAMGLRPRDLASLNEMALDLELRSATHARERYQIIGSVLTKLGVAIPEKPWYPWLKESK